MKWQERIKEDISIEYASESGMIHVMEEDLESFIGKFLEEKLNEAYQKGREDEHNEIAINYQKFIRQQEILNQNQTEKGR